MRQLTVFGHFHRPAFGYPLSAATFSSAGSDRDTAAQPSFSKSIPPFFAYPMTLSRHSISSAPYSGSVREKSSHTDIINPRSRNSELSAFRAPLRSMKSRRVRKAQPRRPTNWHARSLSSGPIVL